MLLTTVAGPMALKTITSLAMFQAQDSINSGNSRLLMVFIGIAAVALLAQAVVVVMVGLGLLKAQKDLMGHLVEIKGKALPLIATSHTLVTDLTPQIKEMTRRVNSISGHVESIAAIAKEKADEFSPTISAANKTVYQATETVAEANRKTREQVGRVNGMVTTALDATARLGAAIEKGITVPGREVAGVISGLKVGFETLISGARAFGAGGPIGRTPPVRPSYRPAPPASVPFRTTEAPSYPRTSKPDLDL